MTTRKFIAYYRVSTKRQGQSGLGLEAQRDAVHEFISGPDASLIEEYTEVESGKRNDRPELERALASCRIHGGTLIIAKLDRLSRNAAFLLTLRDSGADFVCADMPDANNLTVGIMAVIAQDERERISQRTKEALRIAKARGIKLGGDRGNIHLHAARGALESARRRKQAAQDRAADLAPVIHSIRSCGIETLSGIARELNNRNIPAARGGLWRAVQVRRVMKISANQ